MSFFEKMSTADLMENLREELTCFICLDYFTSPVTTECGHSFCLVCLLRSWEEHNTPLSCPECWRTLEIPHFQPNERLGRLAGIGKQLRSQVLHSEGKQGSYEKMLAATRMLSDEELGGHNFSSQGHGVNRMNLSSEAEEHHKVRWEARYKLQNTHQILSHKVMLVAQLRPTLGPPGSSVHQDMEHSPPGSSVQGLLQARIPEWVARPCSRASSWPRDQTWVSHLAGRFFTVWATRGAPTAIIFSTGESHGCQSPGTRPQIWAWILFPLLILSLGHLVSDPQDPFLTWRSAHLPQFVSIAGETPGNTRHFV